MAANVGYQKLPFREQIAFFRNKLNVTTESWTDIYAAEHDWAFMVAGANRNDLVSDFRVAVERAIADGVTLEQFRTDFDNIITRYGWDYNGGRNWRSRIIYDTNLFSSYQAGRFAQQWALRETMPFLQYCHSDAVEHPRELHLSWDGLILYIDDPWWLTHYPINAWGCQCYTLSRSRDDLRRLGKSGPDTAPPIVYEDRIIGKNSPGGPHVVRVPEGIDPGFEYAPGQSRLNSQTPPPADDAIFNSLSSAAPQNDDNIEVFLSEFNASRNEPVVYFDVTGEPMIISENLFIDPVTDKLLSHGREYLPQLAQIIQAPEEIWQFVDYDQATKSAVVKRRYIATVNFNGEPRIGVFETSPNGWLTLSLPATGTLADIRVGQKVYQR